MEINNKTVDSDTLEYEGVDTMDYPDFADAFISEAAFKDGTKLTEGDLDKLNGVSVYVHRNLMKRIF